MKAVVWHGDDVLRISDSPLAPATNGQIVADVRLTGICGSDLHAYRGRPGPRRPPLILGHEAVVTVPGLDGRFVVFPLITCGHCAACRRSEENLCDHRGLLGLDRPGTFAEQVLVDRSALIPVPPDMDDRTAALVEPLATPLAAFRAHGLGGLGRVAVIGCGTIGALAIHVCSTLNIEAVVVDPVAERRRVGLTLGADAAYDDVSKVQCGSVDLAIDAVGAEATCAGAARCVRAGGRVVVIGLADATGEVPIGDPVRSGKSIQGHYAYTFSDFCRALDLLAAQPPDLEWVTVLPLDQARSGFQAMATPDGGLVKVMLDATPSP